MSERTHEIGGAVEHLKKSGILKLIAMSAALGLALLLIGNFAFGEKENKTVGEPVQNSMGADFFLAYKQGIEQEARLLCEGVSGVRSASAVVFFEGMGGSIYAQNVQSGSMEKSEYVIVGSGSGAHALYLGEELPRLCGIGIVCDTGDNEDVRNRLAMLMAATYGLPLTRVYIAEGK